jgi:Arc/MetJ family transcription regulator
MMMTLLTKGVAMRTTVTIDDQLFDKAAALADPNIDKAALLRDCVKAYIELNSARRLAALGGTIPEMEQVPRRDGLVVQ